MLFNFFFKTVVNFVLVNLEAINAGGGLLEIARILNDLPIFSQADLHCRILEQHCDVLIAHCKSADVFLG